MKPLWIAASGAAAVGLCAVLLTTDAVRGDSDRKIDVAKAIVDVVETVEVSKNPSQDPPNEPPPLKLTPEEAARKGIEWLVAVQGDNGGWGQDGGETSFVRVGENLESNGNDVANTAIAVLALVESGHTPNEGAHSKVVRRGLEFILGQIEASPEDGLAVTSVTGTQIQRKLGPFIPTFLSARLLAELDGEIDDAKLSSRVRAGLEKCVRKIEDNQQSDGSWNMSGGWAPILGTSMASRSLAIAKDKDVDVSEMVMARVDDYTKRSALPAASPATARGGGIVGGVARGAEAGIVADGASAGIALYKGAQLLEQLSRTEEDREANKQEIAAVTGQLAGKRFVRGFGSYGGEEFFSYLNISDSLRRSGGEEWQNWNGRITPTLVRLQNEEGSWAGHHCITGRVAVTGAAVLTLLVDEESAAEDI